MQGRVPRQPPQALAPEVEEDAKAAPEEDERHVQHDGRQETASNGPRRDEFRKSIAPDVLVDRDGDEDGAGDGLVAVDRVRGGDGGDGSDLDPGAGVADDDDDLEVGRAVSVIALEWVEVLKDG